MLRFLRGTVADQDAIVSILMSMPPLARWEYNYVPAADSPEAKLYQYYLRPQDWLNSKEPDLVARQWQL